MLIHQWSLKFWRCLDSALPGNPDLTFKVAVRLLQVGLADDVARGQRTAQEVEAEAEPLLDMPRQSRVVAHSKFPQKIYIYNNVVFWGVGRGEQISNTSLASNSLGDSLLKKKAINDNPIEVPAVPTSLDGPRSASGGPLTSTLLEATISSSLSSSEVRFLPVPDARRVSSSF